MSRRSRDSQSPAAARSSTRAARDPSWTAFGLACATLFLTRFWLPAESAETGETLWIVVAWLVVAALSAWVGLRSGRFRWRPGAAEAAVGLLVAAQVMAAIAVCLTSGDKRAAVNLLWEWIGVGVAFALLRCWVNGESERQRLTALLLAVGLVLAGLGVWQRWVWYPSIQAEYLEWEQLQSGARGRTPEVNRRILELRERLGPDLLALDGPGHAALRQRVLDSVEPFGRFGLTNTFGGVLGAILVVLWGCRPRGRTARWFLFAAAMALIGTVLISTRSRTAWLATLCGLAYLTVAHWAGTAGHARWRTLAPRLLVGLLCLIPLALLAQFAGAIDPQDWVEAPKSVLYRLQYWAATWPIIGNHPWLGVGPGNFRQHYLRYKLPEASEEIADPHNMFLDVWTSGGLLALAGLVCVLGLAAKAWLSGWRGDRAATTETFPSAAPPVTWSWLCLVGWSTCGLVYLVTYICAFRNEQELLWLAIGWMPAAWIAQTMLRSAAARERDLGPIAASLMLTIHLQTSGGIAMPVVALLLLVMAFVLPTPHNDVPGINGARLRNSQLIDAAHVTAARFQKQIASHPARTAAMIAVGSVLLAAACLLTAWLPSTLATLHRSAGSLALYAEGRPEQARDRFRHATESDPWDSGAWRDLAWAEGALWQRGGTEADPHFAAAIAALESAIAADPASPHGYRAAGELWLRRAQQSDDVSAAQAAVIALRQALDRFPSSGPIHAELADALALSGSRTEAAAAARRALELDDLFVAAGHYDKTMTSSERDRLIHLQAASEK